jgi:hypothetical protein
MPPSTHPVLSPARRAASIPRPLVRVTLSGPLRDIGVGAAVPGSVEPALQVAASGQLSSSPEATRSDVRPPTTDWATPELVSLAPGVVPGAALPVSPVSSLP